MQFSTCNLLVIHVLFLTIFEVVTMLLEIKKREEKMRQCQWHLGFPERGNHMCSRRGHGQISACTKEQISWFTQWTEFQGGMKSLGGKWFRSKVSGCQAQGLFLVVELRILGPRGLGDLGFGGFFAFMINECLITHFCTIRIYYPETIFIGPQGHVHFHHLFSQNLSLSLLKIIFFNWDLIDI